MPRVNRLESHKNQVRRHRTDESVPSLLPKECNGKGRQSPCRNFNVHQGWQGTCGVPAKAQQNECRCVEGPHKVVRYGSGDFAGAVIGSRRTRNTDAHVAAEKQHHPPLDKLRVP